MTEPKLTADQLACDAMLDAADHLLPGSRTFAEALQQERSAMWDIMCVAVELQHNETRREIESLKVAVEHSQRLVTAHVMGVGFLLAIAAAGAYIHLSMLLASLGAS